MPAGTYRNITGNLALAYGLVAAGQLRRSCRCSSAPTRSPRPRTSCTSCPSTSGFGVTTFQAEDEIAGVGAALGASFGGALGVTTTSGPGVALKSETIGLAVIASSCRCWSSTSSAAAPRPACRPRPSRPTCCRRCSAATARRRSPIVAPRVARRLLRRRHRGRPDRADLPHAGDPAVRRLPRQRLGAVARARRRLPARPGRRVRDRAERTGRRAADFWPYLRDADTLARPWAVPGTPGLEHRIGGLEKADVTRRHLLRPRQPRPHGAAAPGQDRRHRGPGPRRSTTRTATPRCWCSAGARRTARSAPACRRVRNAGRRVAQAHLRHLNPCPANLGEVLRALPPRRRARR